MKQSREQWEQELRDRQRNVTPEDELRNLSLSTRNLNPRDALFRGPRQLAFGASGSIAMIAGLFSEWLAWSLYQARHAPAVWQPVFVWCAGAAVLGALLIWGGFKLFFGSILDSDHPQGK